MLFMLQCLPPIEHKRQKVLFVGPLILLHCNECRICLGIAGFGGGRVHIPFHVAEWNRDIFGTTAFHCL